MVKLRTAIHIYHLTIYRFTVLLLLSDLSQLIDIPEKTQEEDMDFLMDLEQELLSIADGDDTEVSSSGNLTKEINDPGYYYVA